MKLATRIFAIACGLGIALLAGFVGIRARSIAKELTDPPFYKPQPLSRVEATYTELAVGSQGDPGGTWSSEEVSGLQLWRLRRAKPSRGVALLLHGFGDDRWGTSPALRVFPDLDAAIFTYLRRDDALRKGGPVPPITFGARESDNVVTIVHHLEASGIPRRQILVMGRSLGASVGLLALAKLEADGGGPLGGFIWEGAPASSRDFGERIVRGPKDQFWHPFLAPIIGELGSRLAASRGGYDRRETDLRALLAHRRLATPGLCFLATQDRLAPVSAQRAFVAAFDQIEVIEADTWHLHCAEVLGATYPEAIRRATKRWLP
ncbi:MAG: hypothetical protein H6Q00_2114 [Holophagaceae bacterium]|nr:hypothetical protein [Holophagaceae bacterium]